jgi:crotonobetainyl-CoA:carnitine CoA-transferase CaiB-like acyl-CoA transferase
LCEIVGAPGLARDVCYATNAARVSHRDALIARLSVVLQTRPLAHWLRELQAQGVPCAPVNAIDQVFADPQVQARGMRIELPHAAAGSVPLVANPLRFSETPVEYTHAPPSLGADTRALLSERLGLDEDRIEQLLAAGVIGDGCDGAGSQSGFTSAGMIRG